MCRCRDRYLCCCYCCWWWWWWCGRVACAIFDEQVANKRLSLKTLLSRYSLSIHSLDTLSRYSLSIHSLDTLSRYSSLDTLSKLSLSHTHSLSLSLSLTGARIDSIVVDSITGARESESRSRVQAVPPLLILKDLASLMYSPF